MPWVPVTFGNVKSFGCVKMVADQEVDFYHITERKSGKILEEALYGQWVNNECHEKYPYGCMKAKAGMYT